MSTLVYVPKIDVLEKLLQLAKQFSVDLFCPESD